MREKENGAASYPTCWALTQVYGSPELVRISGHPVRTGFSDLSPLQWTLQVLRTDGPWTGISPPDSPEALPIPHSALSLSPWFFPVPTRLSY